MPARPRDTVVLVDDDGVLAPVDATDDEWAVDDRPPAPASDDVDERWLHHAWCGLVPIAAKYVTRGNRAKLDPLLLGIGAPTVPDDPADQLLVVRERLAAPDGSSS